MGCEVVVFSSTESKRTEAIELGSKEFHFTNDVMEFEGIKKIKHLLIGRSAQPGCSDVLSIPLPAGEPLYPLIVSFDESPVPMLALLVEGLRIQGSSVNHKLKPTTMIREGRMRYRGVLLEE
ncbi:hypothetical protein BJ546DRAFT_1119820 [Cryomyces antarcticus]